jgi:hypothetical protein
MCGMSRDPGEDSARDRTADRGLVFLGHVCPNFINGDYFTLWNFSHELINFYWRRDHNRATTPSLAHLFVYLNYFGQAFTVMQFFMP